MRVLAINASPRKNANTATLLEHALQGALSQGAQGELVHLYDLVFKGCVSCFACKRKGNACNGLCAVQDSLTDVLRAALGSDVLLMGTPIYFGDVTGGLRSFLERLLFPILTYNADRRRAREVTIAAGLLFTMNAPQEYCATGYRELMEKHQGLLRLLGGGSETLACCDTWQFRDYSLFEASGIDEARKARVRAEQFPQDCRRAFELGARLTIQRQKLFSK